MNLTKNVGKLKRELMKRRRDFRRDYSWRHKRDIYSIFVAELLLQRTRADQVEKVYDNFLKEFPDLESLAEAKFRCVNKCIRTLGLPDRTKKLIGAARYLKKECGGIFPNKREDLMKVPGIGQYSSGAILLIAFNKPEYVVDSNVVRILQRVLGIEARGELRKNKKILQCAKRLFESKNPKQLLFSVLDFSALCCKPIGPTCKSCYLKRWCRYNSAN